MTKYPAARGFTLMETLIAMTLAATILLPASFWLYHSRASQAAWDKFRATQALESELNRAVLLRWDHDAIRETSSPFYLKLVLHIERNADETRILGQALDRQGRPLAELKAGYFAEAP
ncbi:MAG: prepilin-type N-terminal cleavage/methylation domain-containing protein [Fibrobacteres bacterium]|jgi:prepilin-type N-terminal cleavage/methylation domain-containing protein|nr:prepilin-type N-terminal cleavage/methylation domain-containing protein [Fibrobacterota bacterium]